MPRDLTPAGRVKRLVDLYGSDDKLAAELGTSRQMVIKWRQGQVKNPRPDTIARLLQAEAKVGITEPWPSAQGETLPRGLAREVRLIRQAVEAIADGMDDLARAMQELQALQREQEKPAPRRRAGANG